MAKEAETLFAEWARPLCLWGVPGGRAGCAGGGLFLSAVGPGDTKRRAAGVPHALR